MNRHLHLSGPGALLISTDVHGNLADHMRLEQIFHTLRAEGRDPRWVILGDLVHGPSAEGRARHPDVCDYDDASAEVVARVIALREAWPERVFFVLGNHDYAHIGGVHTAKFHDDETEHLESNMNPDAIAAMHALFRSALLVVTTSCGVMLCHGAPDDTFHSLDLLDDMPLPPPAWHTGQHALLQNILWSYGQTGPIMQRVFDQLNTAPALAHTPQRVLVHGHDRDEHGWFTEGGNQVCPVIFGAPPHTRRYTLLDLDAHYTCAGDIRDGIELLRLHEDAPHG